MTKNILFDRKLEFEINLIGYKHKGESIIFFLRTDGKIVYSGIVDCYEDEAKNEAIELLKKENISYVNFICWTHPHDDHSVGLEKILSDYCNEQTSCWIPPFVSKDIKDCSSTAKNIYKKIFEILESKKRKKMVIREASDSKTLEKFKCIGNCSINPYSFEIKSFAPDTNILQKFKIQERFKMENEYSVGLIINIGHFIIILGGDVENRTINSIPDYNLYVEELDYLKIPHHSSESAMNLVDRFKHLGISSPSVATTTVYRSNGLPKETVLKKYIRWGNNMEIYSTGDVCDEKNDEDRIGIIRTSFDILENKEIPIETYLIGNAVKVEFTI